MLLLLLPLATGAPSSAALQPAGTHIDYLEVGCSDFDTLLQKTTLTGLSVEPIPYYLDRLPNRPGAIKVNAAVSNVSGVGTMNWLEPRVIGKNCDVDFATAHKLTGCLPYYTRGMSTLTKSLDSGSLEAKYGLDPNDPELLHRTPIPLLTVSTIFDQHGVDSVHFVKVDTEGADAIVVQSVLDAAVQRPSRTPEHILYENVHLAPHTRVALEASLKRHGFLCHPFDEPGIEKTDFMYHANTACSVEGATTPFPDYERRGPV